MFDFYIKFVPRYFDCYLFFSYTFLDWIYLFIFIPQHLILFYFYIKFGPHFSQFYFFGSFLLIFFIFTPHYLVDLKFGFLIFLDFPFMIPSELVTHFKCLRDQTQSHDQVIDLVCRLKFNPIVFFIFSIFFILNIFSSFFIRHLIC